MKTIIRSTNPVATYNEAITSLETVTVMLEHARKLLADVDMEHTVCTRFSSLQRRGQYANLMDLISMADTLLEDARNARCEYCCQLLVGNDACLRNECPSLKELREDNLA